MADTITFLNRQRRVQFDLGWLRRAGKLALPICQNLSDDGRFALARLPEIGVVVVSDARIAQIHAEFMNIEGPTDVITFAHGEIVTSAEMARAYASDYGHPVEHELALYTVHGLLHLNGYDDLSPAPATRMRRTQTRVLKRILSQLPSL